MSKLMEWSLNIERACATQSPSPARSFVTANPTRGAAITPISEMKMVEDAPQRGLSGIIHPGRGGVSLMPHTRP